MVAEETKRRINKIRASNKKQLTGITLDKLQEGDYNYDVPRPVEQTLGYYAKQLRKKLEVMQ